MANVQENYPCNVGTQSTNNFPQKNNLQFCLDLSGPTFPKEIICAILDNVSEETNLYNVGLTCLVQPQVTKMKLNAKYHASKKQAFRK